MNDGVLMIRYMLRTYLYFLLITAFVLSCKKRTKHSDSFQTIEEKSTFLGDSSLLLLKERRRPFSSLDSKDLFQLKVEGNKILSAVVIFKIFNSVGDKVYEDRFNAFDLVNREELELQNPSEDERSAYIKKRIEHFFDEDNFLTPAIDPKAEYIENIESKAVWDSLRKDKVSIGFEYKLGIKDLKKISYSKKLKKVVVYFNCC